MKTKQQRLRNFRRYIWKLLVVFRKTMFGRDLIELFMFYIDGKFGAEEDIDPGVYYAKLHQMDIIDLNEYRLITSVLNDMYVDAIKKGWSYNEISMFKPYDYKSYRNYFSDFITKCKKRNLKIRNHNVIFLPFVTLIVVLCVCVWIFINNALKAK
jgi:hypothetical protein